MRCFWHGVVAVASFWAFGPLAQAQDVDETPILMNRVPAVVMEAAKAAAPGVRLTKATKTIEEGRTYFDLYGQDGKGREVDVELTARGTVLGVAVEITMSQVPKVVIAALRAKARGMSFTDAEMITKNGRIISYRFEGETSDGDDVEATVSADGRTVEIDVDDEKP
jgi:uncharacterized membrane protein YkoI